MSTTIPLTRGQSAVVDDADAEAVLAAGKWFAYRGRDETTFYALRPRVLPVRGMPLELEYRGRHTLDLPHDVVR